MKPVAAGSFLRESLSVISLASNRDNKEPDGKNYLQEFVNKKNAEKVKFCAIRHAKRQQIMKNCVKKMF